MSQRPLVSHRGAEENVFSGSPSLGPTSCLGGDTPKRRMCPLEDAPAGLALAVSCPVAGGRGPGIVLGTVTACTAPVQQPLQSRGRDSERQARRKGPGH